MTEAISVAAAVLSLIVGLVSFVGIVIAMVLGGLEGRRKKLEDEVEKQKHKKVCLHPFQRRPLFGPNSLQ